MNTDVSVTAVRRRHDGWVPLLIVITVLGLVYDANSRHGDFRRDGLAIFSRREASVDRDDFKSADLISVFGSQRLDLRRAVFDGGTPTVGAVALFGEVELVVPAGSRIVGDRVPLLGSVRVRTSGGSGPGPEIRVNAVAIFGSVVIHN